MWPQYWDFFVQNNLKVTNFMSSEVFLVLLHVSGYQYNVSKSAVVTLTRCIGNEVLRGIERKSHQSLDAVYLHMTTEIYSYILES